MSEWVLEAREIGRRFGGVVALRGVSFELAAGEVHALCGENGAGKSTLIRILAGVHPAGSYEGGILVDGREAAFRSTRDAEAAGIGVIHQELALFPDLSVAENLLLGALPCRLGLIDWHAVHARARALLAEVGIELDLGARVGDLGIGQQQLIEIARALARRPRILVLDEPTAALARHEIDTLLALVRRLRAQGVACIYISHKLDEVFAVADRITVLRDGAVQGTSVARDTDAATVIAQMVGRRIEDLYPRRRSTPGGEALAVRALEVARSARGEPLLHGVGFALRAGEVLGIGGLLGAGRTELLMHLMGLWGERRGGTVEVGGRALPAGDVRAAMCAGLALVTEDRKRLGLVPGAGVAFNLTLSSLERIVRHGFVDGAAEADAAGRVAADLRIKAQTLAAPVDTLSGGNQQKIVIGRALLTRPRILLLDEPTRGIDVGAKLEVYELINRLTAAGQAIVLVSSELPELMGMSDRIVMMHEGRIGGIYERGAATQEELLAAAMGRASARAA
ncbi:MAG: sugar ABC transporter ATP-binding protein [Steroidobacteraceae bacterium]